MAKAVTKKAKTKSPKIKSGEELPLDQAESAATIASATAAETPAPEPAPKREPVMANDQDAVRYSSRPPTPPPVDEDAPLQPPTGPIEASVPAQPRGVVEPRRNERDKIANSLNIAKLQGMPMNELNTMAKDMGVENYGTMRKHEVIFHILQKNAERAGIAGAVGGEVRQISRTGET